MKRLIVIGGFLGSGKTSMILAVAKRLLAAGHKLGIVTNDQGSQLVDTAFLAQNGLSVLEVDGGCFCCNFDTFVQKIEELSRDKLPDYILAEPVGSCTDLVATIYKPMLRHGYTLERLGSDFALSPLTVLCDPKRLSRQLKNLPPNEIDYLFDKQLSEANVIALNKCDTQDDATIATLTAHLRQRYHADVLAVSATQGIGMDAFLAAVTGETVGEGRDMDSLEIDYDVYAAAEAALGWLNNNYLVSCDLATTDAVAFDGNALLERLLSYIAHRCAAEDCDIAHLKAYAVGQHDFCKGSITDTTAPPTLDARMGRDVTEVNLIINARVVAEPQQLADIVGDAVDAVCAGLRVVTASASQFAPSRPNPTHRYA